MHNIPQNRMGRYDNLWAMAAVSRMNNYNAIVQGSGPNMTRNLHGNARTVCITR